MKLKSINEQDDIKFQPLVENIITREGKEMDVTGDVWNLPYSVRDTSTLNFEKITDLNMRTALKEHVIDCIKRTSTHSGYVAFQDVWREVLRHLDEHVDDLDVESRLINVFENAINQARSRHRLWAMYRPIQWYLWCAENFPESCFSETYALELEVMQIPGNPKGEAVRMQDPENGPLNRSLELPLLIDALNSDKGNKTKHFQQKVVVVLMIAFGRNPANLTYLRESDLKCQFPDSEDPCYTLRMPRIKKRLLDPTDDFLEEYLDPKFGRIVEELLDHNKSITLNFNGRLYSTPEERPLLINQRGNTAAMRANDIENAFNMSSVGISKLLQGFVKRHNIISPITGKLLNASPRRLRYTLATGLAAEGVSKRELARILDHTDTQHVNVYFEMAGQIVESLDKATVKGFAEYLDFFKGKFINSETDAVNGERDDKHLSFVDEQNPLDQVDIGVCGESNICHLDPPFSCYLCPKFQPYWQADHEHVVDCLLKSRTERIKKYENSRMGIQLDQVIAAVAQVIKICEERKSHA